MSKSVIKIKNLSKSYMIGHEGKAAPGTLTLRDSLTGIIKKPIELLTGHKLKKEKFWALKDINIEINQGDVVGIIGRNGSGKSTTLRVLSGLLRPREGAVEMEGRDITSDSIQDRLRAGIALLPQGRSTFPHMTVAENLELGAWLLKSNRKRMAESIERAYAQFPILGDRRSVRAGELSGGQQQQLEIARTLLTDPKVILIDEPAVGLSPLLASEVYTHIMRLREEGRTIVLVDQNVEAAIEICDYVYLSVQ